MEDEGIARSKQTEGVGGLGAEFDIVGACELIEARQERRSERSHRCDRKQQGALLEGGEQQIKDGCEVGDGVGRSESKASDGRSASPGYLLALFFRSTREDGFE